jgi:hypothetical protein
MTRTPYLLALLSTVALVGFSGCGDEDDPIVDTGTAELRVVHAAPGAPAVDIYAAGISMPLLTNLAYGDTSEYLVVDEGDYTIEVRAAGADATSEPAYSVGPLSLGEDDRITAIASGLLGSTDTADQFRVLPVAEGFSMPDSGNAIVRIVHASADAPAVAIDVANDGTPEISNLERFANTGATGVQLPADSALQVGIWAGDPLARVTAFTTPELPDGAELFVIATGLLGELPDDADGFRLLAVGPSGSIGFIKQNPSVQAFHGSPDAPSVDIYAGDALLSENIAFGDLSAPIQVPPGSYDLDFYATGTGPGTPAATATTPELAAGERYLAIASGFLLRDDGSEAFQLLPLADEFDADADNARLRIVHASPDAPAVDISTVTNDVMDTPLLVDGAAFTQDTGGAGLQVPAANLTVGVSATGDTDPIVTFDIATSSGLRAYVVAAGALAPIDDEEGFRLMIIDASAYPWAAVEVLPN